MIEYNHGKPELICDICGHTEDNFDTFQEAVAFKKENSWRSKKNNYGEWEEICPVCWLGGK